MVGSELTPEALQASMEKLQTEERTKIDGPMANRTADAKIPFLRGHKDSLVHWQLLDDDAVKRAEKENKLIFMHIGYSACHHCDLMDSESFSHPECISILNEAFVPVLVDREERPDIDTIYMNYVQAVSNVGGWPLNLFLTPSLEPVFGGTYWPGPGSSSPSSAAGSEEEVLDFLAILKKLQETWRDQEARCRREATEVAAQLREFAAEGVLGTRSIKLASGTATPLPRSAPGSLPTSESKSKGSLLSSELDLDQLEEAYRNIAGTFDPVYGGFGLAPKFPVAPKLEFLLQLLKLPQPVQDVVGEAECQHAQNMALHTLRQIRDGALRDHVGGRGFFRCSVTPDWSIPNFEKLVVDNALLLALFVEAWKASGGKEDTEFLDVVLELAEYLTSAPIAIPQSGFASSESADSHVRRGSSDVREGAYYLWTRREFDSVTGAANNHVSQVAAAHWDTHEDGNVDQGHDPNDNFINQNILRVVKTPAELSSQFSIPVDTAKEYILDARKALQVRRESERMQPAVDDKMVTGWNGLTVSALAKTAAALKDLRPVESDKYLSICNTAVAFIKSQLWDDSTKQLYRIWKDGRSTLGLADDYAYLICGLLDLYDATDDESHLSFADHLTETYLLNFHDHSSGGFFTTAPTTHHAILRLKDGMDTSLPSINAVSASNLFRLGTLLDDAKYTRLARETVNAFEAEILQHPWLFPGLLASVVTARLGVPDDVRARTPQWRKDRQVKG